MIKEDILDKIKSKIQCRNYKRLGRCFESNNKKYFYDLGTGKIFLVEPEVFDLLNLILDNKWDEAVKISSQSKSDVYESIINENILLAPELNSYIGVQISDLENQLLRNRAQITLELTEKCNMRCKYCIYQEGQGGYREFGNHDMTFEVAKLAIDDLIEHSQDEKVIFVSFYGGEPLLKFDLLKQCIDYCETIKGKNISYALTTNGTLVDRDMANYFSRLGERIHITISLDGPKYMNDKYRVYGDGKGTFDDAVRGAKLIINEFSKNGSKLSLGINSVLPEYHEHDLNSIEHYFESQEWLPSDVVFTSSFVATKDKEMDYLGIDSPIEEEIICNSKKIKGYFDPLFDWASPSENENMTSKIIAKDNVIKELAMIHRRLLFDSPMESYYMCGCCVPGARRVYVTTKGEYLICEKLGEAPDIGNVYEGLDLGKIKKHYVTDYCEQTIPYCNDCWAVHLCGMCYMNCYDHEGINLKLRHSKCIMNRIYIEKNLELYHKILELNSEALSILDDYDFS